MRAWIEDVVVDGEARGKGVGEALNRFAIDLAAEHERSVDLTSRPAGRAANRLYRRLGFEPARPTSTATRADGDGQISGRIDPDHRTFQR